MIPYDELCQARARWAGQRQNEAEMMELEGETGHAHAAPPPVDVDGFVHEDAVADLSAIATDQNADLTQALADEMVADAEGADPYAYADEAHAEAGAAEYPEAYAEGAYDEDAGAHAYDAEDQLEAYAEAAPDAGEAYEEAPPSVKVSIDDPTQITHLPDAGSHEQAGDGDALTHQATELVPEGADGLGGVPTIVPGEGEEPYDSKEGEA